MDEVCIADCPSFRFMDVMSIPVATANTPTITGAPGSYVLNYSWSGTNTPTSYTVSLYQVIQSVTTVATTLTGTVLTSSTYSNLVTEASYYSIVTATNGTGTSSPVTSSSVSFYNPFGGPQGVQGVQGISGANGVQGPPGPQGQQGIQGIVNFSAGSGEGRDSNYVITTTTDPGTIKANSGLTWDGTILNVAANGNTAGVIVAGTGSNTIGGVTLVTSNVDTDGVVTARGVSAHRLGPVTFTNGALTGVTTINASTIGGVGISAGALTGVTTISAGTGSSTIGGVTLSNSNISTSGTITVSSLSSSIGGVTLNNNNISTSGTISAGTGSSTIGGVTLNGNNISTTGTISAGTGSNTIGGVTLSNTRIIVGAPTTGAAGSGSINTTSGYFLDGVPLPNTLGAENFMVAVGVNTSTLNTSHDGVNWTSRTQSAFTSGGGAAWNGYLWVVVGTAGAFGLGPPGVVITSPDGVTWTTQTISGADRLFCVAWNGMLWVCGGVGGSSGTIHTSTDGITWTSRTATGFGSGFVDSVTWAGSLWIAGGQSLGVGQISTSPDGITWTSRYTSGSGTFRAVAWNGVTALAVSTQGLAYSTSGTSWTVGAINGGGDAGGYRSVAWNGSSWMIGGASTTNVYTNTTPAAQLTGWSVARSTGVNGSVGALVWNGSLWVAGGGGGTLASSVDGITWTVRASTLGVGALASRTRNNNYTSTLFTPSASSNSIGGVTLSNNVVSTGGTVVAGGGGTHSLGVINFANGAITGATSLNTITIGASGNVSGMGTLGCGLITAPTATNTINGLIINAGTCTGVDFVATSDRRLKSSISTISNALETVKGLRGVYFTRLGETKRSVGVIAQEVEEVLPEVVHGDDMKSVSYGNIVGLLIEAVKELSEKMER